MNALDAFAISLVASQLLTPWMGWCGRKLRLMSNPDGQRRLHSQPIPQCGGIAVLLALLLGLAAHIIISGERLAPVFITPFCISAGLLCLLGIADDRFEISAGIKLSAQALAVSPAVLVPWTASGHVPWTASGHAGWRLEQLSLFGASIELGWWGPAAAMFWLILGVNALNLIDGMDGLACSVGIIVSLGTAVLGWWVGAPEVVVVAAAMAGALAGFLRYNFPPARIYLGDCGSTVVGFGLAYFTLRIAIAAPGGGRFHVGVAALLLLIPILDTCLAMVRRTLRGESWFTADRGHVHHQLLSRGWTVPRTLLFFSGFCGLTTVLAVLAVISQKELWAWLVLGSTLILLADVRLIGNEERKLFKKRFIVGDRPNSELPKTVLGGAATSNPIYPINVVEEDSRQVVATENADSSRPSPPGCQQPRPLANEVFGQQPRNKAA